MKANKILIILIFLLPLKLMAQDTISLGQPGSRPLLKVYRPVGKNREKTAVIICSGGSYGRTADGEEGTPAARLLAANEITTFLLDYRPPGTLTSGKDSIPFADAQMAIKYVREHAKEYHVKTNQIGIMGFSAGGHLVSTIGTHLDKTYIDNPSETNLHPDFMVLVYPVISMADSLTHLRSRFNLLGREITPERVKAFSNELLVTGQTAPTFIVAAIDDKEVKVQNSLYFAAALRQHRVSVEMFLYTKGGHGFGVNNRSAQVQWTDETIKWIKSRLWRSRE